MNMTNKCPDCGANLDDFRAYCSCGRKNEFCAKSGPEPLVEAVSNERTQEKSGEVILLGFLTIVLVSIAFSVLFFKDSNPWILTGFVSFLTICIYFKFFTKSSHVNSACSWSKSVLSDKSNYVILDTETTGLTEKSEIIQIAIIDLNGNTLLDSFVRPERKKAIPKSATEIHGITWEHIAEAPTFRKLLDQITELLRGKTVIAYNAEFDERMCSQTAERYDLVFPRVPWKCAMLEYSKFVGEWNSYRKDWKWQKLPGAGHRSIDDCRATLRVIQRMAEA